MVDTLPANVTFRSMTASQGSCTRTGQTVRCNLGDLGDGDVATITIVVRPSQKGTISNYGDGLGGGSGGQRAGQQLGSTTTTVVGP